MPLRSRCRRTCHDQWIESIVARGGGERRQVTPSDPLGLAVVHALQQTLFSSACPSKPLWGLLSLELLPLKGVRTPDQRDTDYPHFPPLRCISHHFPPTFFETWKCPDHAVFIGINDTYAAQRQMAWKINFSTRQMCDECFDDGRSISINRGHTRNYVINRAWQ